MGKPERSRALGRPSPVWGDNGKMDLEVRGWEGVDYIYVAQNRAKWQIIVNTIQDLRLP